jgi:hypothetical protein
MTTGVGAILLAAVACNNNKDGREEERGAAPPPIASTKPGVCASGGGKVSDAVSAAFLPRAAGDYCIDPNGETRAYGENAGGTLDKVCTELFDGECEVYKTYGLKRVVTLRYVDGKGSPGSVNVNLSRFASKDGAYAFFTKRVIADADPLESAPAKLEAGGAGALGTGIAYVWRGDHVAELSYTNELESPEQLKQSSSRALPGLAKALGEKLPGDTSLPGAVRALPDAGRVAMGTAYDAKDALGVAGVGPGALGFYQDGKKRWRVLSLVRADEDSAKDVMKTLKKLDGAKGMKGVPIEALQFGLREDDSSPRVEWVAARKGASVFGIGDEEHVLSSDQAPAEAASVKLTLDEKLERLKALAGGDDAGSAPK